jgi:hypothetical protein
MVAKRSGSVRSRALRTHPLPSTQLYPAKASRCASANAADFETPVSGSACCIAAGFLDRRAPVTTRAWMPGRGDSQRQDARGTTTVGRKNSRRSFDSFVTRIDRLARTAVRARAATLADRAANRHEHRRENASSTCPGCSPGSRRTSAARQIEGIAKAKAAGVYNGRPPSIDASRAARIESAGPAAYRHCEGAQDWPTFGLPNPPAKSRRLCRRDNSHGAELAYRT